jgi:hypothetical protein
MAIVRLDKIAGIHLESVRVAEPILNGYFLQLGGLVSGETEVRQATKVVDPTKEGIVFHATPEVMADPRKSGLKHFVVEANEQARAYHLMKGDIITLTEDLFETVPSVGDLVAPQANSYLLDASLGNESVILEVIQETTLGYDNTRAFVLSVLKA